MPQTLSTSSFKTKVLCVVAVLVTLALIAGGILVHSQMVRREDISNDKSTFFEDTNYDVLFLGSSHMHMGISPFHLYKNYGITSYNLSTMSQHLPMSYSVLLNAISYNKPNIVVLDVFHCSKGMLDDRERYGYWHFALDPFKISKNKIMSIFDLNNNIRTELLFPYILYHNRWYEMQNLFSSLLLRQNYEINKGKGHNYYTALKDIARNVIDYKEMEWISKNIYLDNENIDYINIKYIEKIETLCKENNICLILTYLPPASGLLHQEESNTIKKISDTLNIPYYDMLYIADNIIDIDIDLYDCLIAENIYGYGNCHLNFSGARKVTDYIGNILRNDFNVPDHRGEAEYAKWDEDYKEYRKAIFAQMRGINDFDTLLMACNFADISVKLYATENAVFDNVEQKLVAQLKDNIEIIQRARQETDCDVRVVITDDETGDTVTEKAFNIGSAFHTK